MDTQNTHRSAFANLEGFTQEQLDGLADILQGNTWNKVLFKFKERPEADDAAAQLQSGDTSS
jgi:hypothetical protein